jgi:hypothetical protein
MLMVAASGFAAPVLFRTASATDEDPAAAGRKAAEALKSALGGVEPQVVLMADCFEDKENKEKALAAVTAVLGRDKVCGGATYGTFTQAGALTQDAVGLLAISGVKVSVAFEGKLCAAGLTMEKDEAALTAALGGAGQRLAKKLTGADKGKLLIMIADAHSPKNQLLLDGVQSVVGKKLPVTGGSVNKNAGQNWIYYQGKAYTDAAVALLLSGDFDLAQAGRQAKDNDAVISTAKDGAGEAQTKLGKKPFAVLAFDCAGRKGKLKNVGDELSAIQASLGRDVPLFGCYCAGEFGPADATDVDKSICYGRGWHVMITALGTK